MIKNIIISCFLLMFAFTLNVNSATINYGVVTIDSPELDAGSDISKKKATLKEAQVKFKDGSVYVGPIKKNKLNGKGKLTLSDGTVYEGKFKSNKFINKISRKNRTFIKLDLKKGIKVENQIKVQGLTKWYPADVVGGKFELSKKGKLMAAQDKKKAESSSGGGGGGSGC